MTIVLKATDSQLFTMPPMISIARDSRERIKKEYLFKNANMSVWLYDNNTLSTALDDDLRKLI